MVVNNILGKGNLFYHLLALFTSTIWGTTFISTKILLSNGLPPAEILLFRFLIAYVSILFISHKRMLADNVKDEFTFLLAGLCGGSIYFVTENMALDHTLASNVSIIICTAPLLTALLVKIFHKSHKFKSSFVTGSMIALLGVVFVVLNGNYLLKISPVGDILTISAALSWAFYSIIVKGLNDKYPPLLVTRKVFFYGIITLLPYFIFKPLHVNFEVLSRPVVFYNFIFLGFIASMLCFFIWNIVIKNIEAESASNYIYLGSMITIITGYIFIAETVTIVAVTGAILIIFGGYVAEKGFGFKSVFSSLKKNIGKADS